MPLDHIEIYAAHVGHLLAEANKTIEYLKSRRRTELLELKTLALRGEYEALVEELDRRLESKDF